MLSIIVPLINEAKGLPILLPALKQLQQQGCEVLLVDGGSEDDSVAIARLAGFVVVDSARGRALQMNAGAALATGTVLVFLHADTQLPAQAPALIMVATMQGKYHWGRFNVNIAGKSPLLKVVGCLINWRSRVTGIATGDQAIFIRRATFEQIGGFPQQPLMEDIELCKRLKANFAPACLTARVTTSGRRWDERGVWRTIFLMWRLRWAYWRGVPIEKIAAAYR